MSVASLEARLQALERGLVAIEQVVLNLRVSLSEVRAALVGAVEVVRLPGVAVATEAAAGPAVPTARGHQDGRVYCVFVPAPDHLPGIYLSYGSYAEAVRDHNIGWNPPDVFHYYPDSESHSHPNLAAGLQAWEQVFPGSVAPQFA